MAMGIFLVVVGGVMIANSVDWGWLVVVIGLMMIWSNKD